MIKPIEHIINIDLINKINMNKSIIIKKNDTNSHKFVINIFNSGINYDLTGTTARIYFKKSDGTKVFLDCALDVALTGKLSCLLTTQALSCAGLVASEITIYGTAGEILTSVTFDFTVSSVIRDDLAIESTSEFTALTTALNSVEEALVSVPTIEALKIALDNGISSGTILDTTLKSDITTGNALDTTLKGDITTGNALDIALKADISTGNVLDVALKSDITTGDILDVSLKADISTGNPLDISLKADISTGNPLDVALKDDIAIGNPLDILLKDDIATGNITDTNIKDSTIIGDATDADLKADIIIAGQNEFATEISNARGGEINLDTRLDKVDTSLANKVIKGELFINVKDYGAVGDGTTDDTQAFIDANNTLINGGIIYIPVGKFVLKSQLTLSKGVNLVGVKSKDDEKQGSAIYITNSTTQAIVLNSGCSVEGITFYYPTQLNTGAGSAIVFPSLFLSNVGGASDIDILDCAFINVYQIADFTNSHGGITVQRCTGFVLNLGFDVDNCTDIDRFKDIHINPIFWKDAFSPTDFSQITRANAILFKLKRADWIIIENCFCWGYNKGIYITDGVSGSIASGDIKNCGFDMTEKGIYCDTASAWGINIEGCSFSAQDPINIAEIHNAIEFTAIGYGISIKNNKFWGCTGGTIKLISISGTPKGVIIEGNQIMSWGSKSISTDLQYGILVQNVEGLIVGNNILKGNSYAYARGIRLISCRNQVITGNVIQDIANDGIMVLDAGGLPISDYYIVKHNIIKTTGNAISDTATGINKLVTENLA